MSATELKSEAWDEIIIATGIGPRTPDIPGVNHASVMSYEQVIANGGEGVGQRVAIIGAGGIGFDVAELLSHKGVSASLDVDVFAKEWGLDFAKHPRGGVAGIKPAPESSGREIFLLQRKPSSPGRGLGLTTGWAHKLSLLRKGVEMLAAVEYQQINDEGLAITIEGEPRQLKVDTIVLCAGQQSQRQLYDELVASDVNNIHIIGGAELAAEIDAKRAIDQGARLAASL